MTKSEHFCDFQLLQCFHYNVLFYIFALMLRKFPILRALFLLTVFAYPQVQNPLHAFEHRNDFHCDATAEQHLHTSEHICALCDFSVQLGQTSCQLELQAPTVVSLNGYILPVCHEVPSTSWSLTPPRAPPV